MDTYEPGSTFKAVTAAAGLEEGAVTRETVFTCRPFEGFFVRPINCWNTRGTHGTQNLARAVHNSCNPAFMRTALNLGVDTFYQYVRDFGFYERTNILLPGEVRGIFQAQPRELDMLVASFGQRFTITPIQLITAYAAIANGGYLMRPRLVRELTDSDGNVVRSYSPEIIRKVVSRETSEELRTILEGVVTDGTGRNAYVSGFRVAGKTGTSETVYEGRYIASFAAFAPADNPVVCVLIVLDEPRGPYHMGGAIAAPVARSLLEDILVYMEIEREFTESDRSAMARDVSTPDLSGMTLNDAIRTLRGAGLDYKVVGSDNDMERVITMQAPPFEFRVPARSTVFLYTEHTGDVLMVAVPDLRNKTVSEATDALHRINLNIRVIGGSGSSRSQNVSPGVLVSEGSVIEVSFIYTDNIE